MSDLNLIQTVTLDKYIVKLYAINAPSALSVAQNNMESLEADLNNQTYAKEIVDILEQFDEFTKIEIYDKN
ncbi:hypothetical protein EB001_20930, partial [bacterium]|nr:hypothetical protein [bacterium]